MNKDFVCQWNYDQMMWRDRRKSLHIETLYSSIKMGKGSDNYRPSPLGEI
jgi:hypothetical protein